MQLSAPRQAVGQTRQAYNRLDMATKLGLNAVDKVFDRTAGVQDLDEEEEKLVKAFLKEEQLEVGKCTRRRSTTQSHMTETAEREEGCRYQQGQGWEASELGQDT